MPEKFDPEDLIANILNKVKVRDMMTKNPVTVEMDDPFSLVEEKLRLHAIRHLPVVNAANKVVGIVTERDLFRIRSPRVDPDGTRYYLKEVLDEYILEHAMTKNPFTLQPDDSAAVAIMAMADNKIGCIPVVNEKNVLKGIVTRHDFIKTVARILKKKMTPSGNRPAPKD